MADWYKRLAAVECPDATFLGDPSGLTLADGQGSIVRDSEGRSFIDLCAGFGALPFGHDAQAIADALEAGGLVQGLGDVYPSVWKVELLEMLARLFPATPTGALALSGSQAVEYAVKTALLSTKRHRFVCFDSGYHGLELGILNLSARESFRQPFETGLGRYTVQRLPFGAPMDRVRSALGAPEPAAAVIVEPIQGRGGVRLPPLGWLATVRAACREIGALFIADEVQTGLGRAGSWSLTADLQPDLLCLGKILGGGLPISACLGSRSAMAAWPRSSGEALHTGTFFGHALSCRVALKTLQRLETEDWPRQVAERGADIEKRLAELNDVGVVAEVRGQGLMWAIAFAKPHLGVQAMQALRERGVLSIPSGDHGECLALTPAFTIGATELNTALDAIRQTCRAMTG